MVIWAFLTKRRAIHHIHRVLWDWLLFLTINKTWWDFWWRDLLYLRHDLGCQYCSGTFWNKGFTPGWPFVQGSPCSWPCRCLQTDLSRRRSYKYGCLLRGCDAISEKRGRICEGGWDVHLGCKNQTCSFCQGCFLIFVLSYVVTLLFIHSFRPQLASLYRREIWWNWTKREWKILTLYIATHIVSSGINKPVNPLKKWCCFDIRRALFQNNTE